MLCVIIFPLGYFLEQGPPEDRSQDLMFKIQTAWQLDRLLIWATTAEGAVRVEGTEGTEGTEGAALVAPLTPEALRDQLGEICSDALVIGTDTENNLDI